MVLNLARLALSATLMTAPPAGTYAAQPAVANDSLVLLTPDAINKLATFWKSFMTETPDIRDTGRQQNQEKISVPLGKVTGVQAPPTMQTQVVNMVAMAQKYPSVAAKLKAAGLTPQEWEQDRMALFSATVTNQIDKSGKEAGDGSTLWKNVAMLRAHQQEFQALQATGMYIPKVQMGGGGGGGGGNDDLSP